MNDIYEALEQTILTIGNAIIAAGKIVLFIATIPLVFYYLHERHKIEKRLRKLGRWPY